MHHWWLSNRNGGGGVLVFNAGFLLEIFLVVTVTVFVIVIVVVIVTVVVTVVVVVIVILSSEMVVSVPCVQNFDLNQVEDKAHDRDYEHDVSFHFRWHEEAPGGLNQKNHSHNPDTEDGN